MGENAIGKVETKTKNATNDMMNFAIEWGIPLVAGSAGWLSGMATFGWVKAAINPFASRVSISGINPNSLANIITGGAIMLIGTEIGKMLGNNYIAKAIRFYMLGAGLKFLYNGAIGFVGA